MYFVLLFCIFALCLLVHHAYSKRDIRLLTKIPGPKVWPIVGNTLNYAVSTEKLFIYLRFLYKTYGGINNIYSINMQAVNIYHPDDIEIIMSSTRFNTKHRPYTFLKPWLSEGLLVSNGEKWQQRRKLLTKSFHFNILQKYVQKFTERAKIFVEQINKEDGKNIDLLPLITETTLKLMCETTMGTLKGATNSCCDTHQYFEALHGLGQVLTLRMSRVWLYFNFIFVLSNLYRTQEKLIKQLHDFTTSIIKDKKEKYNYKDAIEKPEEDGVYGVKGNLSFLDLLLENEREGKIDLNGIREEVDTFMFEGHDTTAMAISFFVMRIANEPEAQDKIYTEMHRIFGDSTRSPTMEDLNEMKYLECCIKESLRLYPSVPFITRHLTEDVTLSGYTVPSGTTCHIHIFDLHHCAKIYPHPEEFIPERFLPQNSIQRHPYAYIPFSAGPRNCIGQKFAMLEMKCLMSVLLRSYRVEPITKPQDLVFKADLVLRTNHPLYVRFCARN